MTDLESSLGFYLSVASWIVIWGGIGGMIGGRLKDRPLEGFLFGAILGPFGLLIALAMATHHATCPECKSLIPRDARRCRYCRSDIVAAEPEPAKEKNVESPWGDYGQNEDGPDVGISSEPTASETDIDDWLNR